VDSFDTVRVLAREKHELMRRKSGGSGRAVALLEAARQAENVVICSLPPEHPLLAGGQGALHKTSSTPSLYVSSAVSDEQAAYIEAHEFGHLWIETPADPIIVPLDSDPSTPEQPTPLGLKRVEA
jgi:DNA helicase-2/ATP-dependent DNA helicase PcrA